MRIIKFRGKIWRDFFDPTLIGFMGKDYKDDFVYGQLAYDDKGNPLILGEALEVNNDYVNFEYWVPVQLETVGQCTGLRDKHGTVIYEGDVLAYKNKDNMSCNFTVNYSDYKNGWLGQNEYEICDLLPSSFCKAEVVGIVHNCIRGVICNG